MTRPNTHRGDRGFALPSAMAGMFIVFLAMAFMTALAIRDIRDSSKTVGMVEARAVGEAAVDEIQARLIDNPNYVITDATGVRAVAAHPGYVADITVDPMTPDGTGTIRLAQFNEYGRAEPCDFTGRPCFRFTVEDGVNNLTVDGQDATRYLPGVQAAVVEVESWSRCTRASVERCFGEARFRSTIKRRTFLEYLIHANQEFVDPHAGEAAVPAAYHRMNSADYLIGPIHTNASELLICGELTFFGVVEVSMDPTRPDFNPNGWRKAEGDGCENAPDPTFRNADFSPAERPLNGEQLDLPRDALGRLQSTADLVIDAKAPDVVDIRLDGTGIYLNGSDEPLEGKPSIIYISDPDGPDPDPPTTPQEIAARGFDGSARVTATGTWNGQLTIAADGNITIDSDIKYACSGTGTDPEVGVSSAGASPDQDPNRAWYQGDSGCDDVLGLNAAEGIVIAYPAGQPTVPGSFNRTIHAAMLSLNHSVYVDRWDTSPIGQTCAAPPCTPPTLKIVGSIIGEYRGVYGAYDRATGILSSGFAKNFRHDQRLANTLQPPFFAQPAGTPWVKLDVVELPSRQEYVRNDRAVAPPPPSTTPTTLLPPTTVVPPTLPENEFERGFYIDDAGILEGNSGARNMVFTVRRNSVLGSQASSIQWRTVDGTATVADNDYVASSGTVNFGPGSGVQQILVPVRGDLKVEPDEHFFVEIFGATDPNEPVRTPGGVAVPSYRARGTIATDDFAVPQIRIDDAEVIEDNNADRKEPRFLEFRIWSNIPVPRDTVMTVQTADITARAPEDYRPFSANVTIREGQTETILKIEVFDNDEIENTETMRVTISPCTCSPGEMNIVDNQAIGTILQPGLILEDFKDRETDVDKVFRIPVKLNDKFTKKITVDYTTRNGTATAPADYVAKSGTITFNPGETEKFVEITVKGEIVRENDEDFWIDFSNLQGLPSNAYTPDRHLKVTIETDEPLLYLRVTGGGNVNEGGSATFTFSLVTANGAVYAPGSKEPVTIGYSIGGDAQAADWSAPAARSHTFPVGTNNHQVTVQALDDSILEFNQNVNVTITSCCGPGADGIHTATATMTIIDTDTFTLTGMTGGTVAENSSANGTISYSCTCTSYERPATVSWSGSGAISTSGSSNPSGGSGSITYTVFGVNDMCATTTNRSGTAFASSATGSSRSAGWTVTNRYNWSNAGTGNGHSVPGNTSTTRYNVTSTQTHYYADIQTRSSSTATWSTTGSYSSHTAWPADTTTRRYINKYTLTHYYWTQQNCVLI